MFGVPGAKRVRREELQSPASSPRSSPDPEIEALLRSRLAAELAFTAADNDAGIVEDAPQSDDEDAELRLFAAPANAAPKSYKIKRSSPDASNGEPGFRVKKPRTYYFVNEPTDEEKAMLQAVSMDGKTVLELSREPWPGCALPWKVRRISAEGMKKEILVGHPPMLVTVEERIKKRTRKNKKTRIAIRKKLQTTKDVREEKARLAKEKEEAEREKRTKRNREKKVKKKAREKAKKGVDGAGEEVAEQSDGKEDDSQD